MKNPDRPGDIHTLFQSMEPDLKQIIAGHPVVTEDGHLAISCSNYSKRTCWKIRRSTEGHGGSSILPAPITKIFLHGPGACWPVS
jgi:hypothetical protein